MMEFVTWDDNRNPIFLGKWKIDGNQLPPTRTGVLIQKSHSSQPTGSREPDGVHGIRRQDQGIHDLPQHRLATWWSRGFCRDVEGRYRDVNDMWFYMVGSISSLIWSKMGYMICHDYDYIWLYMVMHIYIHPYGYTMSYGHKAWKKMAYNSSYWVVLKIQRGSPWVRGFLEDWAMVEWLG